MTNRLINVALAVVSFTAVGLSLLTASLLGWNPCYLCITQRALFALLGVTALAGAVAPKMSRLTLGLASGWALAGFATAVSQVYIQFNADKMACSGGQPNMLELPVEWLATNVGSFFQVTGFCSDPYPILGVPMAGWSALLFLGMAVVAVVRVRRAEC